MGDAWGATGGASAKSRRARRRLSGPPKSGRLMKEPRSRRAPLRSGRSCCAWSRLWSRRAAEPPGSHPPRDVTLTVHAQEIVGLAGVMGVGRTESRLCALRRGAARTLAR